MSVLSFNQTPLKANMSVSSTIPYTKRDGLIVFSDAGAVPPTQSSLSPAICL